MESQNLNDLWRENVLMCAQRFSRVMEERFNIEVNGGRVLLPPALDGGPINVKAATEMLEIFLDYMFGTGVALSCHYCSTEQAFEEQLIDLIRDKFSKIRRLEELGEFRRE